VPNPKFRNVARLKPVYQVSTYTDQHGTYPARLANDGSRRTAGDYCAASQPATNPWWAVDLGVPTTVFSVNLTSRGDNNGITRLGISLVNQLRIKLIDHWLEVDFDPSDVGRAVVGPIPMYYKLIPSIWFRRSKAMVYRLISTSTTNTLWPMLVWWCTPCLKKLSKIIFVITTSNFHQIWQFLAQWWQIV